MTNLTPVASFDDVPEIETTTVALGGAGGPVNLPAQALLNRTQYLYIKLNALAPVARSGAYSDLTGLPLLGSAAFQSQSAFATAAQGAKADGAAQRSALAAVAFSGSYTDLTNLPPTGGGIVVQIMPGNGITVDNTNPSRPIVSSRGSLSRPAALISSVAGVVTIDLSQSTEIYLLTLSENVTSWVFENLPAMGFMAEIEIEVAQGASAAFTCVSPASATKTSAGPWTASATLGTCETLGARIDHSGTVTLYPAGPQS